MSPGKYGYHYVRVERIEPSERAHLHSSSASDKKLKLLPSQLLPRVQRGVATVKDEEKIYTQRRMRIKEKWGRIDQPTKAGIMPN